MLVAAVLRIVASHDSSMPVMEFAALASVGAFSGFAALYKPLPAWAQPIWSGRT
ncbi:MAG TPA: hypothetical protein VMA30_18290 [Xanthobacteraceae bacterium]|nr:hypothetical protein [Xanthobacteraceae bacterium]